MYFEQVHASREGIEGKSKMGGTAICSEPISSTIMEEVGNVRVPQTEGTTILGIIYKDGLMLACDTRTSMGSFVSHKCSRKVNRINENIYVCRSGNSADSQKTIELIKYYCSTVKSENRKRGRKHDQEDIANAHVRGNLGNEADLGFDVDRLNNASSNELNIINRNKYYYIDKHFDYNPLVESIAHVTSSVIYENKDFLSCALIIGGYDKKKKYQLYIANLNGSLLPSDTFVCSGSGSIYITSYLQDKYKKDMNKMECFELILNCVKFAIHNDNKSGGLIRIINITDSYVEECTITNTALHFNY